MELKSSAEGEQEVDGSIALRLQKSNRKWGDVAKISVLVIFIFISGEVPTRFCVCVCVLCVFIFLSWFGDCVYSNQIVFLCISGYLVGYVTHPTPGVSSHVTEQTEERDDGMESSLDQSTATEPFVDWSSITAALRLKLTTSGLDRTLQCVLYHITLLTVTKNRYEKSLTNIFRE